MTNVLRLLHWITILCYTRRRYKEDFRANGIDDGKFLAAAIVHAAAKAEKMGVALSLDTYAKRTAQQVIEVGGSWEKGGKVCVVLRRRGDEPHLYDKVIETRNKLFKAILHFSLFRSIWKLTVFAVLHCFRYLEAFGSSLFSLFCTVFAIWKHLEARCSRCFALF